MTGLLTHPNVTHPDEVYQRLVEGGADLAEADALKFYARLALLLINHVGDEDVVAEAIAVARGDLGRGSEE